MRACSGFRMRGGIVAMCAAALAVAATACASSPTSTASSSAPVSGGTAVMAEPPSTTPNYIWPYTPSADFSDINTDNLQYLMYRPLYWFGLNGQPVANNSLSVANPPMFNGEKVTITLKHYVWSNGTQVTASDVMFWLNMVMDQAYSPTWFQYNELSQITPMPAAWDRTASGPSDCASKVSDCATVFNYLNTQSKDLSTYATSPIWSVVDGPWKLSSFNADGHVSFVPNKKYSGPVKPKLSAFEEVPFTTDSAEYDVLQSPSSSTKIDVGYLPQQDAPAKPANAAVGRNPLSARGYTLDPWKIWGINYYVLNYQSTTGNGPIFKQLYFREALAYLMNQAAVISG